MKKLQVIVKPKAILALLSLVAVLTLGFVACSMPTNSIEGEGITTVEVEKPDAESSRSGSDTRVFHSTFNKNYDGWYTWRDGTAAFSKSRASYYESSPNSSDRCIQISPSKTGSSPWSIQLYKKYTKFSKGHEYTITFLARAETGQSRYIRAYVSDSQSPYTQYSRLNNFKLTDKWQVYKFTFTMNHNTDSSAQITFDLGTDSGTGPSTGNPVDVYFDDIRLDEDNGFVKANYSSLYYQGQRFNIRSIAFKNDYENESSSLNLLYSKHHRESDYKTIDQMGFNTVRFAINADWFADDVNLDNHKIWSWMDQNVAWAKKNYIKLIIDMHMPPGDTWLDDNIRNSIPLTSSRWLWNSSSKKTKLKNIWRAIAKRYKDEPTILAYGMLNEPVTTDSTGAQWTDPTTGLAAQLLQIIREQDPNHLVIVDALAGTSMNYQSAKPGFRLSDPLSSTGKNNLAYDFHFYEPSNYTHQGSVWSSAPLDGGTYPDPTQPEFAGDLDWNKDFKAYKTTPGKPTTSWKLFTSPTYKVTDSAIEAGQINMFTKGNLGSGTVYFDKIVIEEISPSNSTRVLKEINISKDSLSSFYNYGAPSDKFLKITNTGYGDNSCLAIRGANSGSDSATWDGSQCWFIVKKDYSYRVKGYMKATSFPSSGVSAGFKMNFWSDIKGNLYARDKNYLRAQIGKWRAYDAPITCLEFGVMKDCFKPGKGGEAYISDIIDVFNEKGMGYSYWNYHGQSMGLFTDSIYSYPVTKNVPLYNVLDRKVNH